MTADEAAKLKKGDTVRFTSAEHPLADRGSTYRNARGRVARAGDTVTVREYVTPEACRTTYGLTQDYQREYIKDGIIVFYCRNYWWNVRPADVEAVSVSVAPIPARSRAWSRPTWPCTCPESTLRQTGCVCGHSQSALPADARTRSGDEATRAHRTGEGSGRDRKQPAKQRPPAR